MKYQVKQNTNGEYFLMFDENDSTSDLKISDLLKQRDAYHEELDCVEEDRNNLLREKEEWEEERDELKKQLHNAHVFISNLGLVKCELLEALKATLKCLQMDSDMEEDFAPEIKLAISAIAKAEGKTT